MALTSCGIPLGGSGAARLQGVIVDQQLSEISGITASGLFADTYWVIDDGGNAAHVYAIDQYGIRKATLTVEGVKKTDWEDISLYRKDGRNYLVIADTGDNGGLRKTLQLHIIAEPAELTNARVQPVRSIAFKFPDGPHDTEAVAVDSTLQQAIIVTKKRKPPLVFSVPLSPSSSVVTAKALGAALHIPAANARDRKDRPALAPYDHQVTAASISPDRTQIALMTYRYLLIYRRSANQGWGDALKGVPSIRKLPLIPQAEAMAYTPDGTSVMVTGEFRLAPFYRIPVKG